MIITITGEEGSGKSTIAKRIAEALQFNHYYIGKLRREAAKEKGMTLAEYNTYGETHPETDFEVDDMQKKLGETEDNFVIEGRTSWFLIPQSIKIFFKVDPKEGATRVFKELKESDHRNEDRKLATVEDVLESHKKRRASDNKRYQKYYGKDCFDENNFDFVIDTTDLNPSQVFDQTITFIKQHPMFQKKA